MGKLSLAKVLRSREAAGVFLAFARAEQSEENIDFFLSIQDFLTAWDAKVGDSAESERQQLCRDVIDKYIKPGASYQVCIGDRKAGAIIETFANGDYSRDMFEEARGIAEATLAMDIFPRFEESASGRELAHYPSLCGEYKTAP